MVLHVLVDRHVVLDAVHPVDLHGIHAGTRRELVRERLARRPGFGTHVAHVLHGDGSRRRLHQVERPERGVEHVVAHVAEGSVAEAADVVPALAEVAATVGPHLRGAHPQVPVHARRRRDHRTQLPLRVEAVAPAPHLADLPQRAALHVLGDERLERTRMPVVAGLRDDAVPPLRRGQEVRLLLGIADRLLDVDVDAALHARDRDRRVRLLVGRDDRRVDLAAHLVQELAVVGEVPRLREVVGRGELRDALPGEAQLRRVRIDERDDLLAEALRHEHAPQTSAAADEGEANLPPRGELPRAALSEGESADVERRSARGQLQEVPSLHLSSP